MLLRLFKRPQPLQTMGVVGIRFASTTATNALNTTGPIVDKQPIPIDVDQIIQTPASVPSVEVTEPSNSIMSNGEIHDAFLQNMPQQVGDLGSLGLSYSWPSGWITQFLEAFYITSELPWWATIILYTLTVRILLLPLIVNMMKIQAKMAKINPKMMACQQDLQIAKEKKDMPKLQKAAERMQKLYADENISPFSALKGPIIQGAILISTFLALRKMADLPVPSFEHGGLWWFSNLAIGDPTYILPMVSTLSVLALFKYSSDLAPPNPNTDKMKKIMPAIALVGAFFVMDFPAAIFVYWITSNIFSILQTFILQTSWARKRFQIPKIEKQAIVKREEGPKELSFMEGFKIAFDAAKDKNKSK